MIYYKITSHHLNGLGKLVPGEGYIAIEADFTQSATAEHRDGHRRSVAEFFGLPESEVISITQEQYESEIAQKSLEDPDEVDLMVASDYGDDEDIHKEGVQH